MEPCNRLITVPIDSTGEVARFSVAELVGFNIDGDASASYAVDVGVETDSGFHWFQDQATYSSTTAVSDSWKQAEPMLRIRVTTAASSGNEARVLVATE